MKKYVIVVAAIVAVGLVGLLLPRGGRDNQSATPTSPAVKTGDKPVAAIAPIKKKPSSMKAAVSPVNDSVRVKPVIEVDDEDEMPPAERALMKRIEQALDGEKPDELVACVSEVRACKNAEVRSAMIDALGWFGSKALPELSLFLSDADEDVRDSARNEWSTAVSEIEDESKKLDAVEMVMGIMDDEDFLEDISSEYIGVDEKLAVESLVRLIKGDGTEKGIAKAKETYEFVTGDEWKSEAEAARWIAEEYTPSEK